MASSTVDQVHSILTARLAELDAEREKLASALVHLGDRSRPSGNASRSTRPPHGRARGRRESTPRGRRQAQVLAALKGSDGMRPSQIAKAIGIAPQQASAILRRLVATGEVRKNGSVYSIA